MKCTNCSKEAESGIKFCSRCKETNRAAGKKYKNKLKDQGLCRQGCGNLVEVGRSRCLYCIDRHVAWQKKPITLVYTHYKPICKCCGEAEILFLTIDHVNNDGFKDVYKDGGRIGGSALCRRIIKEGFPDTYQIMCMNCNLGKSRNNGICPHKVLTI